MSYMIINIGKFERIYRFIYYGENTYCTYEKEMRVMR